MANTSTADGTIELWGDWTQEDIDLLNLVAGVWGTWYYRMELNGTFSLSEKKLTFFGLGRWSFFGTLDSLHQWTLDEIKESSHQLDLETYQALLDRMKEKKLKLALDYKDTLEEGDVLWGDGFLSSDGQKLLYKQGADTADLTDPLPSPISLNWSQFDPKCLEDAVQVFARFLSTPDTKALKEWVQTIEPFFLEQEESWETTYTYMCMDYTDYYVDEDTIRDFVQRFYPDTEAWRCFASIAEDFGYCL